VAGVLPETLAVTCAVTFFRKASGGAHCKTLAGCAILGAVVMTLLGLATRVWGSWLAASLLLLLLPSLIAVTAAFWLAPADVPQKPITSPAQRTLLRRLSLLWTTLWGFLGLYLWLAGRENLLYYYTGGNLGLLWQSLMLTAPGYRLIHLLDVAFFK
jgi:accessory gene regulator B